MEAMSGCVTLQLCEVLLKSQNILEIMVNSIWVEGQLVFNSADSLWY